MQTGEVYVPARYYARLTALLQADGAEVECLLQSSGLSIAQLNEAEAQIRFSRVDHLLQQLPRFTTRTDLPFETGRRLTASAHSFVGFGMLSSATVDEALRFEARYFALVMPSFTMRYSSARDHADLLFTPRIAMSHLCLFFHLEAIALAALREVSDLNGGRLPPCTLHCGYPEPAHVARYHRELGNVAIRFESGAPASVRLRIAEDPRALRMNMADSHALQVAEVRCRALIQRAADGGRFADWVTMTLREVSDALPTLDELAASLNLSRRTINRYLAREGTSFRALAGEIQHQIACERLTAKGMSVTEVAYSLGFSDASNFSRAFRDRAGCSPGQYRKRRPSRSPGAFDALQGDTHIDAAPGEMRKHPR